MKHGTKKKQTTRELTISSGPHYTAAEMRDLRVRATNEWMRRYIEEPEKFNREFETIGLFLAEENANIQPSYGERCEAYLEKLVEELVAADKAAKAAA